MALNSEDAMTPASTRYTIERLLFLPGNFQREPDGKQAESQRNHLRLKDAA